MAIRLKYQPPASVVGGASHLAGAGQRAREQERLAEQQYQFDINAMMGVERLDEQRRQFNSSDDFRRRQADAALWQADQNRQFAAWQQDRQFAEAANRFNATAALQAQRDSRDAALYQNRLQAGLAEEQMRNQARLQEQAMIEQNKRAIAEQEHEWKRQEVELGLREADAKFLEKEISTALEGVDPESLTAESRVQYNSLMGELRARQGNRGQMRSGAYTAALGDWLSRFQEESSTWSTSEPPSIEDQAKDSVHFYPDGGVYVRNPRDGRYMPPPKKDDPAEIEAKRMEKQQAELQKQKDDFKRRYREYEKDIIAERQSAYDAASLNNANAKKPEPPSVDDVLERMNTLEQAWSKFQGDDKAEEGWQKHDVKPGDLQHSLQVGEPPRPEFLPNAPSDEDLQSAVIFLSRQAASGGGESKDRPLEVTPEITLEMLLEIAPGRYVRDPVTGRVGQIPSINK